MRSARNSDKTKEDMLTQKIYEDSERGKFNTKRN